MRFNLSSLKVLLPLLNAYVTTDERAKAQAAFDAAKSELEATTKPAAELQTLIECTKAELAKLPSTRTIAELEALMRRGCPTNAVLSGHVKSSCPKYDVEVARAWNETKQATGSLAEPALLWRCF